jgi:hypothetical protein
MAGSHGVTEIELAITAPQTVNVLRFTPNEMINSEDMLCAYLKSNIHEASMSGKPISQVILTLSYMNPSRVERVSYVLSPNTNMFLRLENPFDPTRPASGTNRVDPYNSFTNRFLMKQGITKSSVFANLQRMQKGGSGPVVITQSGSKNALMESAAGYSTGQGNLASMKSELIRKYALR